jgi:hypothetical protein
LPSLRQRYHFERGAGSTLTVAARAPGPAASSLVGFKTSTTGYFLLPESEALP